ncbi:tRNA (adenosine(37)-N6)-threonylcarbamoyltransferase complex dimerization subunit type 1 TsaB [Cereibacter sphaeroides]|uniref:tRNA (adenosine(37)-N6)-threonylcarbamoyltransferase complex dimerization subunit type 1 TsaB n=1 Tax=Cereibacter sphaeroides TaxID=1063 RepID=UPI001F460484|nr:tRNA (adenosine(37)-N6)-threonylcarbamoyltransferase complex dimerization subunit type 1 TsaB [Cereibacter sphaeroides]MCE6961306.1 tRNA (adenosine(37)-N6)-threonylcarbamoyltransferase complex dimerization subunit type 1 TsaB [Cereibacter sphaeroides]MCE6970292.1 tRNA (adenosine(37)-N6)-threonylcarbamoyltransferase complex dimerization subunit type 1 TsaB [Cereibacter sphaeroides]MCE6972080.1 tRNA (adenosine(37)-N6)-threonylcarbamoyltransferase complex dimerization subunit type 1 TsaB [Cereib
MRPEPRLLAFDTSAAHCAAALLSGERLLVLRDEAMDKGQAERLIPLLEEMLAEAGMSWGDLDALAVGTGPGNFTGVRIAVSAARGLALALKRPAIGVTRFDALAFGLPAPVAVIEDARRGEVYLRDGFEPPVIALRDGLQVRAPRQVGSAAFADVEAPRLPLAEAIARVALSRLGEDHPRPAPFYLRGADAAPAADPPPVIL